MSITQLLPLVESLPKVDKFRLMQYLLSAIAQDEGLSVYDQADIDEDQGVQMGSILQRMADRHALAAIADPVAWQVEIREERPLPGRD